MLTCVSAGSSTSARGPGRRPASVRCDCRRGQQQPQQVLGALGVAAHPERSLEHARHHAADTGAPGGRRPLDRPQPLRRGAREVDRLALTTQTSLATPPSAAVTRRRGRVDVRRWPAPVHRAWPCTSRRCARERSQHHRAGDQAASTSAESVRHRRERQHLLTDVPCGAARSGAAAARLLRVSAAPRTLRPWPRLIGRITIVEVGATCASDAVSPHHQVATDGSRRVSPSSRRTAGQERQQRRVLQHAGAEVFTTVTVPWRTHSTSPVTPSREPGRSSSGSHQVSRPGA